MENTFQQTVDLKERMKKASAPPSPPPRPAAPRPVPPPMPVERANDRPAKAERLKNRAAAIDRVYKSEAEEEKKRPELQVINRPAKGRIALPWLKQAVWLVIFLMVAGGAYFLFSRGNDQASVAPAAEWKWYAIKLVTGETYYGEVSDTKADPVVIRNVYYNYDQVNPPAGTEPAEEEVAETANLRLVKRGKETHGPDGTMNIVRAQVVYLEPLKEDSKVLRAILDYEK